MEDFTKIKNILGPLRVFENEPLYKYTYFKIGGSARLFFEAKNVEDLKLALETATEHKIPFVVLGGGANVLVSDQGFEGLEFLLSIPGTVGGGIKINSHFEVEKGEFLGNRLVSAALFDSKTGQVKNVDHEYFNFAYDD